MNSPPSTKLDAGQPLPSTTVPPSNTAATSSAAAEGSTKKVRKPYTITKSRESWTEEEHDKFLEALQLFDRDWKKIEDFVGSKTVIQIRSHAQKYFLKVQKNGTLAHVPPPRPKRKATHPYPQKASKNVPFQVSMPYPSPANTAPGYALWDDAMLLNDTSNRTIPLQDELSNLRGGEADIRSKGTANMASPSAAGLGSSSKILSGLEIPIQRNQTPVLHGVPDFAEVYNFIGSVFDPETKGHVQKLKEMDPINFETVVLLMRNLTVNLSSPDFEKIRKIITSYDVKSKMISVSAGVLSKNPTRNTYCLENATRCFKSKDVELQPSIGNSVCGR